MLTLEYPVYPLIRETFWHTGVKGIVLSYGKRVWSVSDEVKPRVSGFQTRTDGFVKARCKPASMF